jgi:hypothetical protein
LFHHFERFVAEYEELFDQMEINILGKSSRGKKKRAAPADEDRFLNVVSGHPGQREEEGGGRELQEEERVIFLRLLICFPPGASVAAFGSLPIAAFRKSVECQCY